MNTTFTDYGAHQEQVPVEGALEAPTQTLSFQRKQTLYHSGDPAQSVFRVRDGLVRITRMTPEGRVLTVRHVMPGDFFGEQAATRGTRAESAEALPTAQTAAINPATTHHSDLVTITQSLPQQMPRPIDHASPLPTGAPRPRA